MQASQAPAIERLVAHNGGPVSLSKKLGGKPVYQEIQRWLSRGWASPMHILSLSHHAPDGMTVEDLFRDRDISREQKKVARSPATKGRSNLKRRPRASPSHAARQA